MEGSIAFDLLKVANKPRVVTNPDLSTTTAKA